MNAPTFRFLALNADTFAPLRSMTDEQLAERDARWVTVDESPGYPCRVTLQDAVVGERVLALSHVHHDVAGPYRAAGPIFVRPDALTATPSPGEVPAFFGHRLSSLRAYDAAGVMIDATVTAGTQLGEAVVSLFKNPRVAYVQVHNAKPGCYMATVVRA